MSRFIHLHTHSHYSLLGALPKIPDLVRTAKEHNMPALALTDNGNLYGAVEFYKSSKKHDIKPILGVDFYMALRTRHDKEAGVDNRRRRLVLLAENNKGYQNLIKLVTRSHLEGFYYRPRIDHELMKDHSEGLICIVPASNSEVSALIMTHDRDAAQKKLEEYRNIFSPDNVYLEITHHPEIEGHETLQESLINLGKATSTPLVAAHNVYYLNPEDRAAWKTMQSIQSHMGRHETGSLTSDNEDFSFLSPEDALGRFRDLPEALENTERIAERCTVELELGQWLFPDIDIPKNETYESQLKRLAEAGLKRRGIEIDKKVKGRVEYELNVISGKGYAPYFLVVGDLMRHAHEKNILTNTRGSAAGSLVSYAMGITNVNPLEYDLPFERFLNPERPSPPDIDLDIADDKRDVMIDYVRKKYGDDNVAQIGTFGTMKARAAVRDTARALGFDYATGDRIAKMIPFGSQGFPMTIDQAMEDEEDLRRLYKEDPDTKQIIDMAKRIEGCARHISVHAAGVVISPIPLEDIVPVQLDPKAEGKHITQYDMDAVEDVGLLKFDFLGLKNLAILADAIKRVEKLRGIEINVDEIPLDDEKTYAMLARGETMGVFQLAGQAMTKFLKELEPNNINDINAMIALYRPGPMKNIPHYIARKHGKEEVTYYHPKMEKFLKKSYGILVYQDDLMTTALNIAGYTWKTVDKFRKAVGKKIPEEMARQHKIFVEGCMEHSDMTAGEAEGLWELFEPFQGYGFNKAHAASYGQVAYQTAYMKANYPVIYMASLLTADAGDVDKVSEIIAECKRMNVSIYPPSVNESLGDFTVVLDDDGTITDAIQFGLHSIKNFGQGVADAIIQERKARGKFTSLEDFLSRITNKNLNKKSLEALICAGALDEFEERGIMLANLDDLCAYNRAKSQKPEGQDSLFGLMEDTSTVPELQLQKAEPATQEQKLAWEKELLGLYISGHPLEQYKEALAKYDTDIQEMKEELVPGTKTALIGVVEDFRPITTKNGEHMAFARIGDMSGSIETVVFPRLYRTTKELLEQKGCITMTATVSDRGGDINLIAEKIKELKR